MRAAVAAPRFGQQYRMTEAAPVTIVATGPGASAITVDALVYFGAFAVVGCAAAWAETKWHLTTTPDAPCSRGAYISSTPEKQFSTAGLMQ